MVKIPSPVNVRGVEHCGAGFQISLVVNVLFTDELDGNFLRFFFILTDSLGQRRHLQNVLQKKKHVTVFRIHGVDLVRLDGEENAHP